MWLECHAFSVHIHARMGESVVPGVQNNPKGAGPDKSNNI
jgi:hypothetical protein